MPDMISPTANVYRVSTIEVTDFYVSYNNDITPFTELAPKDVIPFGSIVEIFQVNSVEHPLHLHIFPMQVIDTCPGYKIGEYYDSIMTISSGPQDPNSCRLRFTAATHIGKVMLHCHILKHSDNGAMMWLEIVPAQTFNNPPVN